jgi:type IV secretory pathway VirB10-like protein
MNSRLVAVAGIAAAGAVAAGVGAFLALREAPTRPAAQAAAVVSPAPAQEVRAVEETEARVGPVGPAAPTTAQPVDQDKAAARSVSTAPDSRRPKTVRREPLGSTRAVEVAEPAPRPAASREVQAPPAPVEAAPLPGLTAPVAGLPPLATPLPPEPQFEELIIPADAVIGLQLENGISSETARVEDRVAARVTRDVRVAGRLAIPAGSHVEGTVTFVEPGGKFKERARFGVRFHTVVLADGSSVALATETVYREGTAPGNKSAAKIGGAAVGGAVLGAILGGGKGAAIGGSIGAAGGTAAVMSGGRDPATLPAGATVTVRLSGPATITVER